MFSEASVSHSVNRGEGVCIQEGLPAGGMHLEDLHPGVCPTPTCPVVISSGGHCNSRYASYWNAFLFDEMHTYFQAIFGD